MTLFPRLYRRHRAGFTLAILLMLSIAFAAFELVQLALDLLMWLAPQLDALVLAVLRALWC